MPTPTPAGIPPPAALRAASRDAAHQIVRLVAGAPRDLADVHRSPLRALVLTAWLVGIGGDAATTVLMMRTGLYEEANPVAATGMAVLGVVGYTVAVSLLCAVLALVAAARPRGLYATAVVVTLTLIGAGKCWQALSNLWLWLH